MNKASVALGACILCHTSHEGRSMYEAYFRLQKRPFTATPDANCFYASESLRTLLNELVERASSGQGICVLTAPAGTGKTLICRRLLAELTPRFSTLFLPNANFSNRRELLQSIHFELGRRCAGLEEQEARLELISSLRGLVHSGKPAVLIVDEAHLLNERLLEEVRTLATQSEGDEPLLRVILVGQMALEMRLVDPALEALNQRIVCQTYLEPLTRQESREYVEYRVRWADGRPEALFEPGALELIAEVCNGLPRCLNQLCDHSLLLAFVQEAPGVSREIVEQALADLRQLPLHWNESAAAGPLAEGVEGADDPFVLDEQEYGLAADGDDAEPSWILEPAAAIEVGGDDPAVIIDEQTGPLPAPSGWADGTAGLSHVGDAGHGGVTTEPGGVRVFREEPLDDRYAALDRLAPRISRTFEETSLIDDSRPVRSSPPADRVATDKPLDTASSVPESNGLAESPNGAGSNPLAAPEPSTAAIRDDSDDLEPHQIDSTLDAPCELEEELGNSVLDVCLELQNALGDWWEPQSVEATPDYRTEHVGAAVPVDARYDVVEPESNLDTTGRIDRPGRIPGESTRIVPQPNYRHVFSTLRRKLGRATR